MVLVKPLQIPVTPNLGLSSGLFPSISWRLNVCLRWINKDGDPVSISLWFQRHNAPTPPPPLWNFISTMVVVFFYGTDPNLTRIRFYTIHGFTFIDVFSSPQTFCCHLHLCCWICAAHSWYPQCLSFRHQPKKPQLLEYRVFKPAVLCWTAILQAVPIQHFT